MTLKDVKRVRIRHLAQAKLDSEPITMLTAYDAPSARIFDQSGIDVLLVGDSLGTNVLGYPSPLQVTLEDVERSVRAVASASTRPLIVADLPFGTYEASAHQAFESASRLMRAGAHAVKFEGGARVSEQVRLLSNSGIPVMGHLGFTPQSEHALSGFRVQGRDDDGAVRLREDARALQEAGAFSLVLELIPTEVAAMVTDSLNIPTIGIGAGNRTDGQVLVWLDMAGFHERVPSFVREFGRVGQALHHAASSYAQAVRDGEYPDARHSFSE